MPNRNNPAADSTAGRLLLRLQAESIAAREEYLAADRRRVALIYGGDERKGRFLGYGPRFSVLDGEPLSRQVAVCEIALAAMYRSAERCGRAQGALCAGEIYRAPVTSQLERSAA